MAATRPVGFEFRPTDEELVDHHLRLKINGSNNEDHFIDELDVYKHEPWNLHDFYKIQTRDKVYYFFSKKYVKYKNGERRNRATTAGYWNSTGRPGKIISRKTIIGLKKLLVFYQGRQPNGTRTHWFMHEFHLVDDTLTEQGAFVLCRVFKKEDGEENDARVGNEIVDPSSTVHGTVETSIPHVDDGLFGLQSFKRPTQEDLDKINLDTDISYEGTGAVNDEMVSTETPSDLQRDAQPAFPQEIECGAAFHPRRLEITQAMHEEEEKKEKRVEWEMVGPSGTKHAPVETSITQPPMQVGSSSYKDLNHVSDGISNDKYMEFSSEEDIDHNLVADKSYGDVYFGMLDMSQEMEGDVDLAEIRASKIKKMCSLSLVSPAKKEGDHSGEKSSATKISLKMKVGDKPYFPFGYKEEGGNSDEVEEDTENHISSVTYEIGSKTEEENDDDDAEVTKQLVNAGELVGYERNVSSAAQPSAPSAGYMVRVAPIALGFFIVLFGISRVYQKY